MQGRQIGLAVAALLLTGSVTVTALGDEGRRPPHDPRAQDVVHGAPLDPSEAWLIAAGGRIYDNWWEALDRPEPTTTNPAYPSTAKQAGADTWRCKECHGWDYKGRNGVYSKGSHYTGIKGIDGAAGRPVDAIMAILRNADHPYTTDMIRDDEMRRVALFVSTGQVDMARWIDLETRKVKAGDVERGKAIFQTVCANCHGFDGKLLDWGENGDHAYVGTEAVEVPDEVLNKILNSHPGVLMVNLRAFPVEAAAAVLAYAATLPTE